MDELSKSINEKFILLRNEVDNTCSHLHKIHEKFTNCKKGCDECCMNFSILPIEFYSILQSIKDLKLMPNNNPDPESCPFLVNHSCIIYPFRPLICRTHGLPILDMDLEGENWELSFCPLNFKQNDDEYFTHGNCYHQDVYNSKLYMLNLEFIKSFESISYENGEMIELRKFREII